jgi:hypothetical protein
MQVLLQHAKWSHAERLLRLVQTAVAERMIKKHESGDAPPARRPRPGGGGRRRGGRGGAR